MSVYLKVQGELETIWTIWARNNVLIYFISLGIEHIYTQICTVILHLIYMYICLHVNVCVCIYVYIDVFIKIYLWLRGCC